MPNNDLKSQTEEAMIEHLRKLGFYLTFSIESDCILCHDTKGCYSADQFKVVELHAFGPEKDGRNLLYAIQFADSEKGIIMGISKDLNEISDPTLYTKLMLL